MKLADEERELTRLLAEEPSPLGEALFELRQRGPDPSELGSLAARLSLRGIEVSPTPRAPAENLWKKWAWVGGGGVAVALVGLAWRATQPVPPTHEVPPRVVARETLSPPLRPPRASTSAAPAAAPRVSRPLGEPVDVPPSSEEAVTMRGPSASDASEGPKAAEAPAREPTAVPPAAPALGRPSSPASATPVSRTFAQGEAPFIAAGAPSEIELLREARLALRQSPNSALGLADRHAELFPGGKLTQERELIAISALVALGRRTAALSRGARFEQTFPQSPYRKQIGELLSR